MKGRSPLTMRGVQDPGNSAAAHDKALIDQLTQASRASVPQHAHNIDPAIAGVPPQPVPMMNPIAGETAQEAADRKSGKRELSTSKRAAQNRAAQRAFRQRKEGHIKKLEEQVRDYNILLDAYKRLQSENLSLRDYVINLQGRLIESQGEYPQAPLNLDLNAPRDDQLPPGIQNALATHGAATGGLDDAGSGGEGAMAGVEPSPPANEPPPAPARAAAPTAPMQGVTNQQQLQASAAQAVAKTTRRSAAQSAAEKSIEERTDPLLK